LILLILVILSLYRILTMGWPKFWNEGGGEYFVAFFIVVVVSGLLHMLIKSGPEHSRGLLGIIIGHDGRVSTSKLQVALWTYAVFFSLLLLLFHPQGLDRFIKDGLQAEYLVLLGSPAAAAILAKTFTTTKVQEGTIPKPEAEEDPGLVDGITQAVSNDEGRADLFDFQYFLFNVVALSYFFWNFLPDPQDGLPDLPETLVALTGLAAAGYATKKGLATNFPTLTGVYPAAAAPGERILIRGKNLTISSDAEGAFRVSGEQLTQERTNGSVRISGQNLVVKEGEGTSNQVRVLFGGRHEQQIQLANVQPAATNEIEVTVPIGAEPGKSAPVTVIRADGIATEEVPFDIIAGGPRITNVSPHRIVVGLDPEIVIDGVGFVEVDGQESSKNAIKLRGRTLTVIDGWGIGQVRARIPSTQQEAEEQGFAVPSSTELVVYDNKGRKSQPETVELIERRVL
jgi:hypothetical protein